MAGHARGSLPPSILPLARSASPQERFLHAAASNNSRRACSAKSGLELRLTEIGNVRPVKIEDEMRSSYLDYAMSVIVARALPDVRDGLKPSQRRVLVAMHDLNLAPNRGHRKCAKICGDTSGNYHPHGEAVIYPTLVRMAQDFNMRYPLVDGQGNFGSIDNDPPAAMRYTEARLTPIALEMLADIDRDTVDWQANYEGTRQEPLVLPGRFPNLICNGSAGIAVGMATNIPPHNLSETVDALVLLIDNAEATVEDLIKIVPAPDFPTGGILIGREDVRTAYATGHGRVVIRAKASVEEVRGGRWQIIITQLPYQVNKAALQERIAELVRDRRIDGVADMRDESDRQGMRLVIEVKRDAKPQTVLAQLYKHTALQTTYGINMLAIVDGEPRVLNLKRLLTLFIEHRQTVLTRRSQYELNRARARAHVLEGLKIALDHLDAVIRTIRQSESADQALHTLMARYQLTEIQARAILDMQLRRLAALERQEVLDELAELRKTITYLEDLLANPQKILALVREELLELKRKYGDARRSVISLDDNAEISLEDLIPRVETLVTVSTRGYVKRVQPDTYRTQRRGGRGIRGMILRDEDTPRHMVVANTHDNILFFTDRGRVFQLKAHQIPEGDRTAKGVPIINLINIEARETVTAVVGTAEFIGDHYLAMATRMGEIKKVPIGEFASVRSSGLISMDLEPTDELGWVSHLSEGAELILVTEHGQAARFSESGVPSRSRAAGGVRAMRLAAGDRVCGMDVATRNGQILVVTANGFAKRTPVSQFPVHNRGVSGVLAQKVTDRSGPVVAAPVVRGTEEVMVNSSAGTVLRTPVSSVSVQGRAAQGVAFMGLRPGDHIVCVALMDANGNEPTDGAAPKPTPRRRSEGTPAPQGRATQRAGRGTSPPVGGAPANAPSARRRGASPTDSTRRR
ncbi:MAG: DNA gyrase subunit A [Chloroflexi bacterium]|nr:DNA gyrase subunit A [Chloroflexota bacterium]